MNAFPSGLRGKVIKAYLLLKHVLAILPNPTDDQRYLIELINTSMLVYAVYRTEPNRQWVNVDGLLELLLATGACVQGGILSPKSLLPCRLLKLLRWLMAAMLSLVGSLGRMRHRMALSLLHPFLVT